MKWNKTVLVLLTVCVCWSGAQYAIAEDAQILVQADKPGIKVSPLLYGIFFEEIQRAGDGGIYAEMVQNRSFEDADQPQAWRLVKGGETAKGTMALDSSRPLNAKNPHALRVDIAKAGGGRIGVANKGFKGIALQKNAQYLLSLYSRCDDKFKGPICVSLEKADGTVLAQEKIQGIGEDWKKFDCVLTANATESNATLVIWSTASGIVWLDMVSLFPKDTFKGRPNGLRKDLAQMLVDLKPAFLRFPGGCFVEGDKIVNATRWKETIGDVALRPGHWNL